MKVAFIYTPSIHFWEYVYRKYSWLQHAEYDIQMGVLLDEPYGSHSGWQPILADRGYECATFQPGIEPLEKAWLREYGRSPRDPRKTWQIVIEQLLRFQPDIVYNSVSNQYGAGFFRAIRSALPGLKAIVGYVGSFTYDLQRLSELDSVVTCSKEIKDALIEGGIRAFYVPHSFDTNVDRLLGDLPTPKVNKVVFSGNIIRRKGVHLARENLLKAVADSLPLCVYTQSAGQSPVKAMMEWMIGKTASGSARALLSMPIISNLAGRSFPVRRLSRIVLPSEPLMPTALREAVRPPVYGLDSYRIYKSYNVTLNHSGEYKTAENLRLFEATGVGACLLTDWKHNLVEYFEEDAEIVTYRTSEECIEKANWLLNNPVKTVAIGQAARRRCLTSHTFVHRADAFESALKESLQ